MGQLAPVCRARPKGAAGAAFRAMMIPSLVAIPIVLFALLLIGAAVKILREYERAVVFTLGRFQEVKGPGLVLLVPFFQEMVRVDLRIQVIEIPTQDVISRDNVSMKVDAVLYFNVVNPGTSDHQGAILSPRDEHARADNTSCRARSA